MRETRATLLDWLRLFRVRNYPNYLVVIVAALAVCDGDVPIRGLLLQFVLFAVCFYSGIYILNEVADADLDRRHPVKRHRPVPSGRIPAWQALTLAGVLWAIAFGFSDAVYYPLYVAFIAVNLAYTFVLKRHGFRNLIAVTSALRVAMGFLVAGKTALHHPGLMLLCTLFMASVQQVKFGVEGTIGSRRTGTKLLVIAALMIPVSVWCAPEHPIVVAWTTFAMGLWGFVPWRFPPTARWLIGADVPDRQQIDPDSKRPDMVVFDVDGTLCNSMRAILAAVNEMSSQLGFEPISEEQFRAFRGMSVRQIQKTLGLSAWQLARLGRHVRGVLRTRIETLKPIDGIPAQVHELHRAGYRLAIVSSNQRANVEAFLRASDLAVFDEIVTHEGWGTGLWRKRRQLRDLMDDHRDDIGRFVYVCDEIRDIEAALGARMPVIAVGWGANSAEALNVAGAPVLIHDPAELVDAVRRTLDGAASTREAA